MNTNHTPGPWRIWRDMDPKEPVQITAPSDDFVCTMERVNTNHDANARLIAAAPELLAACQAALSRMEDLHSQGYGSTPEETKLRAAIAKATGNPVTK